MPAVEWFSFPSKLLSAFHKRKVDLRAGIVLPLPYDASQRYAAVYEVPGFGSNHKMASQDLRARMLSALAFWIVLDPNGQWGHTLFVDSVNNGPWGSALTTELIPALERRYPSLIADPTARLLRGHSSGGWAVIWLSLTYPHIFGPCWSTAPDPVDFRRFQLIDIYRGGNMFATENAVTLRRLGKTPGALFRGRMRKKVIASQRHGDRPVKSVQREFKTEGERGQWHSWFAVFGPPRCAPLFDPRTGVIDRSVASYYRRYDIAERVRQNRADLRLMQKKVKVLVGSLDSFFLNESLALLQQQVGKGCIQIVDGCDHWTVLESTPGKRIQSDMRDHIRKIART